MYKKTLYFFTVAAMLAVPAMAGKDALGNHDNSQPVEITADSLEVLQDANKAIFSGNVEAKQGEVNIRSQKMTVFYKKEAKGKPKAEKADAEAGQGESKTAPDGKVSRVEIDDNVFISTPKETAQGSRGVYDVDVATITLIGNVTLTSGKNIVKGQKMVYNIKTGQSKMTSGSGAGSSGKKERVRGVFVPGKNN